jgi:UDP-N-acetylglucosamine 4,6-dehydratase/5-epimerase
LIVLFDNQKILITGGTGSLGKSLTKRLLKENVDSVRIFSRNENNQIEMAREFEGEDRLRFHIGDIRDKERLLRSMEGVDIVFHAAALKHVDIVEYNPFESVKTNVIGTQNVIDACHDLKIKTAIGIGTDKAVAPLNVYGATKLLTEKLFTSASNYVDRVQHPTKFVAIRYGNVLGSSGSVVPRFIELIRAKKSIDITDPNMTRFTITMDDALEFILDSIKKSKGADVFVPKLKAYNIMDLKDALFEMLGKTNYKITKIRPGEKLAEVLIGLDEMRNTLESKSDYVTTLGIDSDEELKEKYPDYDKVKDLKKFSSSEAEKVSKNELIEMLNPIINPETI